MSPAHVYTLWWSLGMAAGSGAGVLVLWRRRALSLATAGAIGITWLGLVAGSRLQFRLESLPLAQALAVGPGDLLSSAGRRLPLGLGAGLVLAGLWCVLVRVPWRPVGDAVAVAYSVLMPIGRLGCLGFGCCMGVPCGTWPNPLCRRFPPGSEAYARQLGDGLIPLSASASLPAHPLPAYFALASLVTLGVLLWLLRRDAPDGALLAAFCVLRPAAKLALEPLRAHPSPSLLMTAVPLITLAGTLGVLVVAGLRRLALPRAAGRATAAFLAAYLVVQVTPTHAQSGPEAAPATLPAEWAGALHDYVKDPQRGGRVLRRLARRHDPATLPPAILLAVGDSELRAGDRRAAQRHFERVARDAPGPPWTDWAGLGLGWIALAEGDDDGARRHFEGVRDRGSGSGPLATLVVVLLDAREGAWARAEPALGSLVEDVDSPPAVREAAGLGSGYLLYWQKEYGRAAAAFDRAALTMSGGTLWDDARYGAAMARWRAGDRERALVELRALARVASPGTPPRGDVTPALVSLDRRALMRHVLARQRRLPFHLPEQRLALMLDRDGPALARAMLARQGERVEPPPMTHVAPPADATRHRTMPPTRPPNLVARRPAGAPAAPAVPSWLVVVLLGLLATVAAALLRLLRRTWRERSPRRVALAIVGATCLLAPAPPAGATSECPEARYLVEAESLLPVSALDVSERQLVIEGACGTDSGRVSRGGTRLRGRLPGCGAMPGVVRVKGRRDCETIRGTMRRRLGRPRRLRFEATRSWCGDGRFDPGGGEQCDAGVGCGEGRVCSQECACVAGGTTGSTTTTVPIVLPSTTTTRPPAVCGNGVREEREVCDGDDLGGAVCPEGGLLRCGAGCAFLDTRECFVCGNGVREGDEECDVRDTGGASCDAPGETGGSVACTVDCRIDRGPCHRCGNDRVDPGEQCDDGNLDGGDGCGPECRLECGNGTVEWSNEECDDVNAVAGDGCHLCGLELEYDGGGGELLECALHWSVSGPPPPGPSVVCADGDGACDQGAVAGECVFRVFYCLNRFPWGQGPPPCMPTSVARIEITGESLLGPAALEPTVQDALLATLATTLAGAGATVARDGVTLDAMPPVSLPRVCGAFLLPVPAGAERALSLRVTDPTNAADDDLLRFACEP